MPRSRHKGPVTVCVPVPPAAHTGDIPAVRTAPHSMNVPVVLRPFPRGLTCKAGLSSIQSTLGKTTVHLRFSYISLP